MARGAKGSSKGPSKIDAALKELRGFGLEFPGAHTKSPWPGHLDLAVRDKTFAYLSLEGQPLGISCKLPRSAEAALMLPFAKPTGYGLGKSGWVSAEIPLGDAPPGSRTSGGGVASARPAHASQAAARHRELRARDLGWSG